MSKLSVFVPVQEDWYPCFKIQYQGNITVVRVNLNDNSEDRVNPSKMVTVWGADDFGMEKIFTGDDMINAMPTWLLIVQNGDLTQTWLAKLGFEHC